MTNKKHINPIDSAKLLGAYSHAISVDVGNSKLIFVTGQIAMDEDGEAVAPNNIQQQAEFIFQKIEKILNEAGSSLDDVVKSTIYLKDISKFTEVSTIRNKYFANSKPASTLVEISNTVHKDCDIEIEVIAVL